MRKPLLGLIFCPVCKAQQFDLSIEQENQVEIRQGTVTCQKCQRAYSVQDGILDLLVNPSQEILNEQAGWTQLEKMLSTRTRLMLSLPDGIGEHKATWQCQAENFHYIWSQVKLTGNEKVLDPGRRPLLGHPLLCTSRVLCRRTGCIINALRRPENSRYLPGKRRRLF